MQFSEKDLPSNHKFGIFFTIVFFILFAYFNFKSYITISYIFAALTVIFLITTIIKAEALSSYNKLWMRFAIILGKIISPVVIGLIYFGLITPYSLIMKLLGRDELCIKLTNKKSYWKPRVNDSTTDFNQQY